MDHGKLCYNTQENTGGGDNITVRIFQGGSGGTDVTNNTQPIVAGQQVVLYASYALPSGVTVISQSNIFCRAVPQNAQGPKRRIDQVQYRNCNRESLE